MQVEQLLSQHDKAGQFTGSNASIACGARDRCPAVDGHLLAGRYQIERCLGSGGMGEVYAADDRELGEQVALKIIRPEGTLGAGMMERLRREVQLARRVTHPNVCRVFDLGRHTQPGEDVIFLTMELIGGETMADRLERDGKSAGRRLWPLPGSSAMLWTQPTMPGFCTRDFKCGNVMLIGSGDDPRAVVTDFGIARGSPVVQPDSQAPTASQSMLAGTPAYMSPEQLVGQPLTAASDIYSSGLVLYEMVTGARPFRADSQLNEAVKRLNESPQPPIKEAPEITETWNRTILKCLERRAGQAIPVGARRCRIVARKAGSVVAGCTKEQSPVALGSIIAGSRGHLGIFSS